MRNTALDYVAMTLVIVGGLNWGLVGLFRFDLVDALFGSVAWLARTVYTLVGLAAVYMIYYAFQSEHHPKAMPRAGPSRSS